MRRKQEEAIAEALCYDPKGPSCRRLLLHQEAPGRILVYNQYSDELGGIEEEEYLEE